MGILFRRRGKLESISGTDPIENYSLAHVTNNDTPLKIWDDIQVPLNEIRRRIAFGPPNSIRFIPDNS